MHISNLFGLLAVASTATAFGHFPKRNYEENDYFTLHLRRGADPEAVAKTLQLRYEGTLGSLSDHYTFYAKRGTHQADGTLAELTQTLRKRDLVPQELEDILWHKRSVLTPGRLEKRGPIPAPPAGYVAPAYRNSKPREDMVAKQDNVVTKLEIRDPIFKEQWHILNTLQPGHDINVTGVWLEGITGKNTTVAIIDDGLDMYSNDLKANYFAEGSYDFNDHDPEPKPELAADHHGTRCAGEIAAVKNDVCGVGVAYDAKVAGLRILSKAISDEDEAVAINFNMQKNLIYSCSWGPPDNGMAMDAPNTLIKRAIQNGIQNGRNGLGSVFVFAAGNGAAQEDNCNFDGYTNSIYSITVGAIDRLGQHPYYSEKCSAALVVTYSSGAGDAIHTTDVGEANCYNRHGGTSAAAPLVAGVLALVLEVRPDLHWRDLQYLAIESAVPINEAEDWVQTYIGKKYSHTYAYGKVDAYAMVQKAKDWKSVKPQAWFTSPWQYVRHDIPQGEKGLASIFTVTPEMIKQANIARLEHVQVTMNIDHTRRGDLSVDLISPKGIYSHLSVTRRNDESPNGYESWTFMSVVHWGEPGDGNWTLVVKDTVENEHIGTFTDWRLRLWGESIDASKAKQFPMPTDDDDDDDEETQPGHVVTTSVSVGPTTSLMPHPTDHPERPTAIKDKATTTTGSTSTSTATATTGSSTSSSTASTTSSAAQETATNGYSLPSIFPTFGVSPKTQIWIYGAVAAIIIFCVGLGAFFCVWRRRRGRADRADYEFEMVNDEDVDGASQPLSGEGVRRKRRGGELYDAFAGGSDEELFSDEEDEQYRDEEPSEKNRRRGASPDRELSEKH